MKKIRIFKISFVYTYIGGAFFMEHLQALTYQEKEKLIIHIAKLYRKGKLQRELCMHGMIKESSGSYVNIEIASSVDIILKHMCKEYAMIIQNDFLFMCSKGWWKNLYSTVKYSQYKQAAMDEFLDCLYT